MNKQQHQVIQLQIQDEKNVILQEISTLTQRKVIAEQKLDYEKKVFKSRNEPLRTGKVAFAGMLKGDVFSIDRMDKFSNEIKQIQGFIQKNELELERLKEKESTIDDLYNESLRQQQKELDQKEEKQLLDMKIILGM